jgi:hypothetical protein
MFAEAADAEVFRQEFGGEPMHPSEKGKGNNWSQWKKKAHICRNPKGLTILRIEYVRSRSSRFGLFRDKNQNEVCAGFSCA